MAPSCITSLYWSSFYSFEKYFWTTAQTEWDFTTLNIPMLSTNLTISVFMSDLNKIVKINTYTPEMLRLSAFQKDPPQSTFECTLFKQPGLFLVFLIQACISDLLISSFATPQWQHLDWQPGNCWLQMLDYYVPGNCRIALSKATEANRQWGGQW